MTLPDTPEDAQLQALFDCTADAPSNVQLTKLAARAADIPERRARRLGWLPRLGWGHGLAGIAATVGAVALGWSNWNVAPDVAANRSELQSVAAVPVLGPPLAPTSPRSSLPREAELNAVDARSLMPVGLIAGLDTDWDVEGVSTADIGLDPLYGPPSDADLDAWLEATASLVEGG